MTLLCALYWALGINVLMFFPAYYLKTDKLTDISYCLTFIIISFIALMNTDFFPGAIILTAMLWVWAIRLGGYLLRRIRKIGHDQRFNEMRGDFLKFARFWILQGLTVWVVLIPSIFYLQSKNQRVSGITVIGFVIWGLGFTIEAAADYQKNRFYSQSGSKEKWLNTGLWRYARHPNYFGEILVWVGIYLYTLHSLEFWQPWIGIVSPIYISLLLVFVSGIPLLEKSADAKFGTNHDYQRYKNNTNSLFLWFPKNK